MDDDIITYQEFEKVQTNFTELKDVTSSLSE